MFCRSLAAIFFPCAHLSLPRCSLADSPVSQCATCPPAIPCAISHLTGRHRSLHLFPLSRRSLAEMADARVWFFPSTPLLLPRCSLADLSGIAARYLPERFSDQRAAPDGLVHWLNRCGHGSYGWST
ncbi:hypothetical protein DFH06DRAFT_1169451 [Mycena polygramma]|nr:hypothetical protein DFH06DRAFT_1169451 [Mycena polygramma]